MTTIAAATVSAPDEAGVLTPEALDLVVALQREFAGRREELLLARAERQEQIAAGELPGFLETTREIREGDWRVAPVPADLQDRRVEITGPAGDRKMVINAFNSGARIYMADFEDANSPTWENVVGGQQNLTDAIERTISLEQGEKRYSLNEEVAVLLVRPRGWHLQERHVEVDGKHVSAGLFDFGVYLHRNAERLLERGSGPYFYLPKLESHVEARLWNDVFCFAQDHVGIPRGTIKATVLIETILAAFEMDEILYELRDHSAGLNAGRWDYIFSVIKKFRDRPEFVLPDRVQVTMTVPFMRAYTELLVRTCHARGAHAIGGMAAFIPSRRDPEVNENALARVREDKARESGDGFDGTWVAHPDLVPVAKAEFDAVLGDRPNQLERLREDVTTEASDLLNVAATPGEITEAGVRANVSVGIRYIAAWLQGVGAAAIDNLMEDAATAEISRSQVWQWLRHGRVEYADVERIIGEVMAELPDEPVYVEALEVFEKVALHDVFVDFLTLTAYAQLTRRRGRGLTVSDGTKADDIALALEEAIVSGEIPPGSTLRQEHLSEQFQVSRTPVREALRRLAALGLVSFEPNRGVRVRMLSLDEIREAFMVRAELESLATEIATPKMTDDDLAELERAERRFHRATERLVEMSHDGRQDLEVAREWLHLNHSFHDVIYRAADVPLIERMAKAARRTFLVKPVWATGADLDELYLKNDRQHRAIRDAIAARSPEGAKVLAREHVLSSGRLLEAILDKVSAQSREPARR